LKSYYQDKKKHIIKSCHARFHNNKAILKKYFYFLRLVKSSGLKRKIKLMKT